MRSKAGKGQVQEITNFCPAADKVASNFWKGFLDQSRPSPPCRNGSWTSSFRAVMLDKFNAVLGRRLPTVQL